MEVMSAQFALPREAGDKIFIGRATSMTPVDPEDVANKIYVDSHGASGPQTHIIYLSSAGSGPGITPDGLTMSTAFDSVDDAIVAAIATPPSVIWCTDAGTFDMSAHHTLPNYVNIYMPYATLNSALGRTLTAGPVCDVMVGHCALAVAFAGAPPGPGIFANFSCVNHTAALTVAGSCRLRVMAAVTASITSSDSSLAMIEGGVHTLLLATMTSTIYVMANNVITLEASDTAIIGAIATVIVNIVAAAGATVYVSYNLNSTVMEVGRIHFMTPVATAVAFSFTGGLAAASAPPTSFVRSNIYVTASIAAFGGTQTSSDVVTSDQVLPSPIYYPGAANTIVGKVICVDGGAFCIGTFTVDAVTNLITITKDGALAGKFSGVGDLWIGPMAFGYAVA